MRLTWAQPEDLLPHELVQAEVEGKDVSDLLQRWLDAGGDPTPAVSGASQVPAPPALRALARELLAEADQIVRPTDPREPDDWAAVQQSLLSSAPRRANVASNRLHGAWLGRAAGCLLGKPVEKIPREGIEEILRATGRWPLDRWFTAIGLPADVARRWPWNRRSQPTSLEENIDGMPEDDDLNYPLLALEILERFGSGFTTEDVATVWLDNLPGGRVFTAERAAYRNILAAVPIDEVATTSNPFREWIGALIRADVFGWINPGNPHAAAELAWRDARLTHTRNGIYGAMWAAGLASASLSESSVDAALEVADLVVPPESRLAEAVHFGRDLASRSDLSEQSVREALDALHQRYGHHHWVHVLNNAATISYALAAGEGDFGKSIALAVMAGWDTDSVGATVGGVVGGIIGVEAIEPKWRDPIKGVIRTSLPCGDQSIEGLVRRTEALMGDVS